MANCLNFGKRYEDEHQYFHNPLRFSYLDVHQIGELYCEAGFSIERHRQAVWEITYIVGGKGTVFVDDHPVEVEENDVIVSAPGQWHAVSANRGVPLRFCYLGFMFSGRQSADLERFYRTIKPGRVMKEKALLGMFARSFDELRCKRDFYLMMVSSYVEYIVHTVRRAALTTKESKGVTLLDGRGGSAAHAVARYIDCHYREIDDIRTLAATLGYSYTYLAHIFKDKMGITIGAYIIGKKMQEAKWLLRSGRMNVSQIAARFNYQSVQSFSNSFKKAVGMSPVEYQNASSVQEEV